MPVPLESGLWWWVESGLRWWYRGQWTASEPEPWAAGPEQAGVTPRVGTSGMRKPWMVHSQCRWRWETESLRRTCVPPSRGGEVRQAEPSPLGHAGRCPFLPLPLLRAAGEGGGKGDGASRWQLGDRGLCGRQPGEAAASGERGVRGWRAKRKPLLRPVSWMLALGGNVSPAVSVLHRNGGVRPKLPNGAWRCWAGG